MWSPSTKISSKGEKTLKLYNHSSKTGALVVLVKASSLMPQHIFSSPISSAGSVLSSGSSIPRWMQSNPPAKWMATVGSKMVPVGTKMVPRSPKMVYCDEVHRQSLSVGPWGLERGFCQFWGGSHCDALSVREPFEGVAWKRNCWLGSCNFLPRVETSWLSWSNNSYAGSCLHKIKVKFWGRETYLYWAQSDTSS